MPKELARVMTRYKALDGDVKPLLAELADHVKDYIIMSDSLTVQRQELAERLRALKAKTALDKAAAKDPQVLDLLEQSEKFELLKTDRQKQYFATAKKVHALRSEVVKLEKDIGAVIKAKSGIFTKSKSLPDLQRLLKLTKQLGDDMQAAITAL